jgi:short-subunit dehydrogenase
VKYAVSPRVYLVGRSETRASKIIEDLRALNPDGQISFIKSDVSRLHEVDLACKDIQAKEEKINLLILSPGILTTKGRDGMFLVFSPSSSKLANK